MTHPENPRLLLDTHVFLWLLLGAAELQHSLQRPAIESAAERESLFLSAVSVWEIAAMERYGVLRFSMPLQVWLQKALETPGLRLVSVDREISFAAATLPDRFSGDFADRCIVATARTHNCLLITADSAIHAYAQRGYVRAVGIEEEGA